MASLPSSGGYGIAGAEYYGSEMVRIIFSNTNIRKSAAAKLIRR